MNKTPIQLLRRALDAVERLEPLPDDVQHWLAEGIRDYVNDGKPLEDALGLAVGQGRAWEHPSRLLRQAERDRLLRLAAEHLDGTEASKPGRLERALQTRDSGGFDEIPPEAAYYLRLMVIRFERVPTSRTRISRILNGETTAARRAHNHCY